VLSSLHQTLTTGKLRPTAAERDHASSRHQDVHGGTLVTNPAASIGQGASAGRPGTCSWAAPAAGCICAHRLQANAGAPTGQRHDNVRELWTGLPERRAVAKRQHIGSEQLPTVELPTTEQTQGESQRTTGYTRYWTCSLNIADSAQLSASVCAQVLASRRPSPLRLIRAMPASTTQEAARLTCDVCSRRSRASRRIRARWRSATSWRTRCAS
jgi:hypothetical protein